MTSPVWLITGASRGFGKELALAAQQAGARVVATARDQASLQDLASDQCLTLAQDVADTAQARAIVQQAVDTFGQVDVLINNAGQGLIAPLEETDEATERASFNLHYHGPLALIRAVVPQMRERKAGHIVNISAAAAHGNYAGFSAYGAPKAALECACEALKAEVQPFGIGLTLVVPGPFRTGFIDHAPAPASEVYANTVGRFAAWLAKINGSQPGDPARAAEIIVKLVMEGQAPFRLPLGAYAAKKLKDRAAGAQRDAETWTETAASADFPRA
jgi:NAD(P)-dependent dehydrogenase (short-subunit alcohol dehydrogenase family)